MKLSAKILLLCLIFRFTILSSIKGQDIFRFEHIGSEEGLSQNTAFSILFDSKGFMWIGTMNGLNRYDGYEFKIFRSSAENPVNFTNNRITRLWEDHRGFIWMETYDGFYHFFNSVNETFSSIPSYEGFTGKNEAMKIFLQYSSDILLLGSSVSGLFLLKYDSHDNTYIIRHFEETENNSIPNNRINFIYSDTYGNVWIGTRNGLSFIAKNSLISDNPLFINILQDAIFTAVCELPDKLFFGTNAGIRVYDKLSISSGIQQSPSAYLLKPEWITHLYRTKSGEIVAAIKDKGIFISIDEGKSWRSVKFHSENLENIYEDRFGNLWLTAIDFGVTRLELKTLKSEYYVLTPDEIKPLTDLERPYFYEDSRDNLWIGLHGNGLALFQRHDDKFRFFRNNPDDPNTISSNFVHCVTEDKYGHLWLGTGQVIGGIEKVIMENPAFEHYLPEKEPSDILDNVARAILEDKNNYLWVATKSGKIHLFDSNMFQVRIFNSLPGIGKKSYRNTTYSIFIDNEGFLWLGSKGYGISVSEKPLDKLNSNYANISFRRYEFSENDETSLGNNNIYSICQDKMNNIWIGTYGNGLSLVKNPHEKNLKFIRINQENSNLSSNLVRHILIDSSGNLWVATTFGLNLLERKNIEEGKYDFKVFLMNPQDNKSLIYNDVIHIFEDSEGKLWFGTFGGGADMLESFDGEVAHFKHFLNGEPPGYDIVFGILEDNDKNIWLSTENGLIKINRETGSTEIFNTFNGLGFNNFSENTCCSKNDGSLIFGGYHGFEVVRPWNLPVREMETGVELTRFMLFNKEVPTGQKDSPLKKSISFSDDIYLKYSQSSFSIDFSALDYINPNIIQYAYRLDNFDNSWNYVGNQHRATYTNLSPGYYTFRVKSIRPDGSTSPERTLGIKILPPFWKTPVAYILYSILLITTTILIYNEITRINRYKNALAIEKKVNELKLQFFTNISHEIRTPLTLIIGPLEDMLAEDEIPQSKKLQMNIMLKNARRMLQLTNQLLDFRKVQNNKMELQISEIDIVAFTKEIFENFVPLARHKGINYTFSSDFESFKIFADPNKLDTIIYNIISNAIKFTGTGKNVSVKISEAEKNKFIDISVTDEGPGIPQKNLADIFTRYTILSNNNLAGTGIGLSLSYELAKLHKGDILVASSPGTGSTFTIRLQEGRKHFAGMPEAEPAETFHNVERIQPEDITGVPNYEDDIPLSDSSDRNMLLIIEDNHEILNYLIQSLKPYFTCIGARNGEEGLHLARTLNPDAIITDIRMPGMDGMEMTRKLKEDFSTSHIPVIMVTSKTDMSDQIAGIETGAEAYIVKPFNMEYLKTMASNIINQRSKVSAYYINNSITGANKLKISSRDMDFLKRIVSYVEENYSKNITVSSLAEYCAVSHTLLYNKVKGLTGSSPVEFTRKIKLGIARRFLENGYNVSEAAFKTGFTDVKYFSRIFKAQFGYYPSRHKNGARET